MKFEKIIALLEKLIESKKSKMIDSEDCSMLETEIKEIEAAIKTVKTAMELRKEVKKLTIEKDKFFNLSVEAVEIILRLEKEIRHWRERRDQLDRYCSSKGF